MKHKRYEKWILDEAPLTIAQQHALEAHMTVCDRCQALQMGWSASKQLILQSSMHTPAPGFVDRWQINAQKERQIEAIRKQRLSIFGMILLVFVSTLVYVIATGSFVQIFTNSLTLVSEFIMNITNGLSNIGFWLSRLPIAIPITAGFLFLGLMNAFVMACIFFLWNLNQRKFQTNEIQVD